MLRGRKGGGKLRAAATGTELRSALTLRGGGYVLRTQQRKQRVVRRARSRAMMMARWQEADLKRKSKPVPAEVDALLARDFPSKDQVGICWAALRDCYVTEADAIAAARRYPSLVLPYMNTPSNIVGCYGSLVGLLGVAGAREVCVKNPAVLGNNPSSLAGCTAKEIRDAADLRDFVDTKLPFGLRAWTRTIVVLVVVGIGAALIDR